MSTEKTSRREEKRIFHVSVVNELRFMSQGHAPDVIVASVFEPTTKFPRRVSSPEKESLLLPSALFLDVNDVQQPLVGCRKSNLQYRRN
jgi:hypothetical protein